MGDGKGVCMGVYGCVSGVSLLCAGIVCTCQFHVCACEVHGHMGRGAGRKAHGVLDGKVWAAFMSRGNPAAPALPLSSPPIPPRTLRCP